MNAETQKSILAAAGRYIRSIFEPIDQRVKSLESRIVEKGEPGLPGKDGINGRDGVDGKSVSVDDVLPELRKELKAAIESIPTPKDGRDGINGKDGVNGADGKSLTLEDIQPLVEMKMASWALDFERRAGELLQKAIDRIPAPKDGKDGVNGKDALGWDDMRVEYDGKRTISLVFENGERREVAEIKMPVVIDAGFWKDGMKAEQGDGVTFGGSYWIALTDTDTKPALDNPDYRLAVKKGRDGKDGEKGKDFARPEPLKVS